MTPRLSLTGAAVCAFAAVLAFVGNAPSAVAQASAGTAPARDPAVMGKALFLRCAACHATSASAPAKVGPHLQALNGRHAGGVKGFTYSDAMKKSQIIWDAEQLDRFLTRPASVVPGTSMVFGGIENKQQRAALIAYLETLR